VNKPIKITATVPAQLYVVCWSRQDLNDAIKAGDTETAIRYLSFGERRDPAKWIEVGTAEITVTLKSDDELTAAETLALRAELDAARLAFAAKQADILARISKLQALRNEVEA